MKKRGSTWGIKTNKSRRPEILLSDDKDSVKLGSLLISFPSSNVKSNEVSPTTRSGL